MERLYWLAAPDARERARALEQVREEEMRTGSSVSTEASGLSCQDYVAKGYCFGGKVLAKAASDNVMGPAKNDPAKGCCACGREETYEISQSPCEGNSAIRNVAECRRATVASAKVAVFGTGDASAWQEGCVLHNDDAFFVTAPVTIISARTTSTYALGPACDLTLVD